jgi:hypothetical protein
VQRRQRVFSFSGRFPRKTGCSLGQRQWTGLTRGFGSVRVESARYSGSLRPRNAKACTRACTHALTTVRDRACRALCVPPESNWPKAWANLPQKEAGWALRPLANGRRHHPADTTQNIKQSYAYTCVSQSESRVLHVVRVPGHAGFVTMSLAKSAQRVPRHSNLPPVVNLSRPISH